MIRKALRKNLRNDKGEIIALPTEPIEYLSFFDLTEVSQHSEHKTWHTFVMQDSNNSLNSLHSENGQLPLFKIRKSLKKILSEEFSTSVQMEAKALDDIEMVFLRIATTKRTKNEEKDKKKLLKTTPTYLVYFAGENYFYASKSNPDAIHCQALLKTLRCDAYERIPLSGKHLVSLRQLRFNRDQRENIDHDLWIDPDEKLPILNSFKVEAMTDVKDGDETLLEGIHATLEIEGSDVLNALRKICSTSNLYKTDPTPQWIQKAVYRGRNHVHIRPKQPVSPSKRSRIVLNDLDEMSIVNSDVTIFNRN